MKKNNEEYYSHIKDMFGKIAPFYDLLDMFLSGVRAMVVELVNTKNNPKILDVCTGTGSQAIAFGKKGFYVAGVDLSRDMLKVAEKKNRYDNVKFIASDAADMPFDANQFDISCISFALHYMPVDIREKVLAEIGRVTVPGGGVVIVDHALPKNKISRLLVYHITSLYETMYYPEFIKSDLKALIGKHGIRIEKEIPVGFGAARILKGINQK